MNECQQVSKILKFDPLCIWVWPSCISSRVIWMHIGYDCFGTDLLPRPGRVFCRVQGFDLALDHGRLQTLVEIFEAVHLEWILAKHLRVLKLFPCKASETRRQRQSIKDHQSCEGCHVWRRPRHVMTSDSRPAAGQRWWRCNSAAAKSKERKGNRKKQFHTHLRLGWFSLVQHALSLHLTVARTSWHHADEQQRVCVCVCVWGGAGGGLADMQMRH